MKKDSLPIIIAALVAFVVTALVKWFMPGGSGNGAKEEQKVISMPEIPLMVKKEKKRDDFVLFVAKKFKKDEKIIIGKLKWEKWPANAMQPYFIAKDDKGTALNNGADYSNALKMWANTDIPDGIPLTMSMLTNVDPEKKKQEEKKKAEEEKKKKEKKKSSEFIRKGMRAITFQIDQSAASSTTVLRAGDLVDVLIMEQVGGKVKTHKYKAIRILLIDGVKGGNTNEKHGESDGGNFFGSVVSNLMIPKNVTLEIKEELVETMLKQAASRGIILSARSQNEGEEEEEGEGGTVDKDSNNNDDDSNPKIDIMLNRILEMGKNVSPTKQQLADEAKKTAEKAAEEAKLREKDENMNALMSNIISMNARVAENANNINNRTAKTDKVNNGGNNKENSSKYEIISGKVVGEESEEESEEKAATVYRKLTASKVQFDKDGKVADGTGGGGGSGGK